MSDISKIKVSGVEYDIKDIQARQDLGNLGTRVTELEQHGGGGSVPATGGVTTLHINVTAVDFGTMKATFTADKTPLEMKQASANGPTWCVVTIAAGLMAEEAVSIGIPPAWHGAGVVAFGGVTAFAHDESGDNTTAYAVQAGSEGWLVDLTQFAG